MGSGNKLQLKVSKSLNNIIKNNNCKFVCGLGDNIYDSGCNSPEDNQFETKFEIPYRNIPDNIKFFMCLGNHDYGKYLRLINIDNSVNQILYSYLSQKQDKKWILPDKYYTFKKGNINFFVLDTNIDRMTQKDIKNQINFINKKIKESTSKWNIVYGHHTWRSVGGHGNADSELEYFFNSIFKSGKIDLYMCGHDHSNQFIEKYLPKNKKMYLIVSGTGGQHPDIYFDEKNINENDSKLKHFSKNSGSVMINSTNKTLDITFFNLNKQEYNFIIKK